MRSTMADGIKRWWPLAVLCCFISTRLVLLESTPQLASTLLSLSLACGLLAVGSMAYLLLKRGHLWEPGALSARAALGGTLLLCGPQLGLLLRPSNLVAIDYFLAGCMVPVVVAISAAAFKEVHLATRTLWPGIAASAAMLLLLPQPRVHSVQAAVVLAGLPIATGVGAVLVSQEAPCAGLWRSCIATLAACIVFGMASLARTDPVTAISWPAVVADALTLGCILLAVERLGPLRYSALYLIVPLVLLSYSLVVLRPGLSFRIVLGLVALLASAVALLRSQERTNDETAFQLFR